MTIKHYSLGEKSYTMDDLCWLFDNNLLDKKTFMSVTEMNYQSVNREFSKYIDRKINRYKDEKKILKRRSS